MFEKDGKKYPFEIDEYYSVGLNSLKRIYTQHPKFNGNARLIYELLLDHFNHEYGYAFPSQWELARESGMSRATVNRQIKILEELDLIRVEKTKISGRTNNIYYLKKPLKTIEDFYKKFPEIEKEARERIRKIDEEEEKLKQKEWKEKRKEGEENTIPPEKELRSNKVLEDVVNWL